MGSLADAVDPMSILSKALSSIVPAVGSYPKSTDRRDGGNQGANLCCADMVQHESASSIIFKWSVSSADMVHGLLDGLG